MRLLGYATFILPLLSTNAFAWICEEASLQHFGNRIVLACGVAVSPTLSEARKNAFFDAKEEFDLFCKNSFRCKGNAVELEVKRTDCTTKSPYTCYRALEFTILDKPAPDQDYSSLLEKKEQELSDLYEKIDQIRELQQKAQQVDQAKENLKLYEETKEEKLLSEIGSIRPHVAWESHFKWAAKVGLSYSGKTIQNSSENYDLWGWRLDLERNFNKFLGVGIGAELFSKSTEEQNVSSSSSSSSKKQSLYESNAFFVSLPLTFVSSPSFRLGISPTAIQRTTYLNQTNEKATQSGYGAELYYDYWFNRDSCVYGFSTKAGYQKYEDNGSHTGAGAFNVSLGVMFGI